MSASDSCASSELVARSIGRVLVLVRNGPHMTTDHTRAVMRRMIEAFDTGDTSAVNSFIADAYRDHQGLRGDEITGPDGFRKVVDVARDSLDDLRVTIEDLIAEGDRVAARIRWVGMRQANGAIVERETIDIVRCERGQAIDHWGIRTWVESA